MTQRDIPAPPFLLRSYERIDRPSRETTRIYIEGDGLAWLSKNRASPDPTPINPVALSLAQADKTANVIYLARPCQYNNASSGKACPDKYWQSSRFAPEVIAAMNNAIDDIRERHKLDRMELVGFSGGAAVALLIASQRKDIVSVVTVAGNLDTDAFTRLHHVSPMTASLNPARFASRISHLAQRHFVGGEDRIVPIDIYRSYRAAAGASEKISVTVVPKADHENGWAERWPALLAQRDLAETDRPK